MIIKCVLSKHKRPWITITITNLLIWKLNRLIILIGLRNKNKIGLQRTKIVLITVFSQQK